VTWSPRRSRVCSYALLGSVVVAGILAAAAIGALQLGYRNGAAGPVSVATSQFATMTVLLSVAFNGERLGWWQSVGVGATAVGVA
jgi:drug/metabolite transporter (DMT)-like permease